ncbi:MAG: serine/threonine protein kinase [Myxococcales bacterium]|nr:serine/threonine protein kinase [Myxococcales bacterium]
MRTSAGEERVGRTLGKYTLLRAIGEGGMAVVYEALHRNGNRVALKLLRPEVSVGADVRARFVREGYAANKVPRGAVRILDDDERDGLAYLVMELLDGVTLDVFARAVLDEQSGRGDRRPVPAALAVAIGAHILVTLSLAHDAGVVHRDIKPENVFLERSGTVKLLDFGIARVAMPGEKSSTVTGRVLGTPAFASPEQAYGRRAEVDARSDIYSVGATLFTILSGRLVHEADSPEEALILAATEPAQKLGTVTDIHPAIAEVVDRALRHERDERWPTAAAMGAALREAHRVAFGAPVPDVLDFGLGSSGHCEAETVMPSPRRRLVGVAAVGAVLVGLVGVGIPRSRGPVDGGERAPATEIHVDDAAAVPAAAPAPSQAEPPSHDAPQPAHLEAARSSGAAPSAPGRSRSAQLPKAVPSVVSSSRACGVDIDEDGRKWPRRCP